jgi:hypothetical protein
LDPWGVFLSFLFFGQRRDTCAHTNESNRKTKTKTKTKTTTTTTTMTMTMMTEAQAEKVLTLLGRMAEAAEKMAAPAPSYWETYTFWLALVTLVVCFSTFWWNARHEVHAYFCPAGAEEAAKERAKRAERAKRQAIRELDKEEQEEKKRRRLPLSETEPEPEPQTPIRRHQPSPPLSAPPRVPNFSYQL